MAIVLTLFGGFASIFLTALLVDYYRSISVATAVGWGNIDQGRRYIAWGFDVNERRPNGRPLVIAASYGDLEMVKLLLEKGADPNLGGLSTNNTSPLTAAMLQRKHEVLQLLLDSGAHPDKDSDQLDPYELAGALKDNQSISILKNAGIAVPDSSSPRE